MTTQTDIKNNVQAKAAQLVLQGQVVNYSELFREQYASIGLLEVYETAKAMNPKSKVSFLKRYINA
jgi:hypothetical protein